MYLSKTENVQIPLKASVQKSVQNFFANIDNLFALDKGFPKSYNMLKSNDRN